MKENKRKRTKKPPSEKRRNLDKLAWAIAKVMTKQRGDQTYLNKKVYCKKCAQTYCLGYDGVQQFCRDCYYAPYTVNGLYIPNCQKECVAGVICKTCGG